MILSFMLHPITLYATVGVGFALWFALYLSQKTEIRALARQVENALVESRQASELHVGEIKRLERQLRDIEEQFRLSSHAPVQSSININKRTQALRLLRSGEAPHRVAAALGITRGEVELLVKVQGIVLNSYNTTSSESAGDEDSKIALSA